MDYEKKYRDTVERAIAWRKKYVNSTISEDGTMIKDFDNIFPELKESEDERIRKEMIFYFTEEIPQCSIQEHSDKMKEFISWLERQEVECTKLELKAGNSYFCYKSRWERADSETFKKGLIYKCNKDGVLDNFVIKNPEQHFIEIKDERIAWLKKQCEHANFLSKIQVGDKVTRNEDGVLVNLSQLKRIAKPAENKGKHGMGISEATKQKLEDNLNKALEKETSESWDKFLDEQGKQKSADKVEPKFRKGDWVVDKNGIVKKILSYNNGVYKHTDGYSAQIFEDEWRLWDITKDAKDGDVLTNWNNTVFIYKAIEDETVKFHIAYNEKWDAIKTPSTKLSHLGLPKPQFEFYPATKEQCDTLMKAMADAGYTFDFEKKELKKIKQKPAWSEEDEQMFEHIIEKATLKFSEWNCLKNDEINFLKSLHPQNKQEWTQDDIDMIDWLIRCCEKEHEELCNDRYGHQDIVSDLKRDCRKKWDWLESLKEKVAPQKQWKPSEEQMETLEYYMHTLVCNEHKEILFGLYADLKKLTE